MQPRPSTGRTDAPCAGLRLAQSFQPLLRLALPLLLACLMPPVLAAGNVVQYTYDAAGNIINIQRQSAAGFAITSFTPTSGPVGTAVTIYGAGFDPTPVNNVVKFNGVAATVTASASGSISTAVPSGATTGPVSVTVGTATATSAQPFTVAVPGAPTISSFSPAIGAAGTTVTVTGSNFDTAAGATIVKINGVTATTTVSDPATLTFTVPAAAASGALTVTTSTGTGAAATDFIIPPSGIAAADVASTIRVTPGAPNASIAVPTAGKNGIVLFDLQPAIYYSIQLAAVVVSPTTAAVAYKIIKPDNTALLSGSVTTGAGNRPSIHLPLLPAAGTYSLLLSPGSATLNTKVRVEIDPIVTVDGPAVASNLDFAYQSSRFVFDATANQRIGMALVGLSFTPAAINSTLNDLNAYRPDGTQILPAPRAFCAGPQSGNPEGNCAGEMVAPVTGRYTAIFNPPSNAYATFTFQLTNDAAGTLTADVSQPIALTRVGQYAYYTFTANAGDSFGIDVSNTTLLPRMQQMNVTVYDPSGGIFAGSFATPPRSLYVELGTLTTAGTYSVLVAPNFGAYGTFNLNLKQGPLLQTTDPPISYAPPGITENARFRFNGVTGQNLSIGFPTFNSGGLDAGVAVFAPDRTRVGSTTCRAGWGHCAAMLTKLPQTGVYDVQVQPPDGVKLSGTVNVSDDLTGTLTDGSPVAISATRGGQVARYAFSGTAGQNVTIQLHGLTANPSDANSNVTLQVNRPDGSFLDSASASARTPAATINLAPLPTTGTYTAIVNPTSGVAWAGSLELDQGMPTSVDGPTVSPTTAVGQSLRYTLPVTAGQRLEFGMTGLAYDPASAAATLVTIFGPTGSNVMSTACYTGLAGCDTFTASAPATGTYSMVITPPPAAAISAGVFAISSPLTGSFVINDPAQMVAITRPGQTARYTFSGSAAQLLHLSWSSTVVAGGSSVSVSVLKPDGSTLTSGLFANGVTGGFDLPSLPTTGTYTVVFDPLQGVTMSAPISLTTR